MEKNILLVDDDDKLRELIGAYLEEKGFLVSTCADINQVRELINYLIFDLIILDRMLPGGDGIDLIEKIKSKSNVPILVLTALGDSQNRIKGLKSGAEDYLSKPFEPEELFLRVKTLLKYQSSLSSKSKLIFFGQYKFDLNTMTLKKENEDIYLTQGEKNLLFILAKKYNNDISREILAEGNNKESDLRKIDVQITRLRQKIEKNPKKPRFIQTVRGKGYRLIANQ